MKNPLTPYSLANDVWMAWQYDRPEAGEGMVQLFRRPESPYIRADFPLHGLDPAAMYEVTNVDVEGVTRLSGKELAEKGLTVEIRDPPGAAVIVYKKAE